MRERVVVTRELREARKAMIRQAVADFKEGLISKLEMTQRVHKAYADFPMTEMAVIELYAEWCMR